MNCTCEVVHEPSQEQVDAAVDQVLTTSLTDAVQRGGVCPLCGHSKQVPFWNRRSALSALLLGCLFALTAALVMLHHQDQTERAAAVAAALTQLRDNPAAVQLLGSPMAAEPGVTGSVTHDETGWKEAHLSLLVRGPADEAQVTLVGSQSKGAWAFTTFDLIVEKQHRKLDLVSNRVLAYDPSAYVDVHTMVAMQPRFLRDAPPPPAGDGTFPCITANATDYTSPPSLGRCAMPTSHSGSVDRFEVDLRYGAFILRQTDLRVVDVFDVPLTRSYRSDDWRGENRSHAFGVNSNHPYDMAPLGTRNPYTSQVLTLEDGDALYFERISKGTGYADAVFQHTETSTRFYKATTSWNGHGWTTRLADGSSIEFPESYNAKNLAQGAATLIRNPAGEELHLNRSPQRDLEEILTPHHHWIRFHYDDYSRITRAEDSSGGWASYIYNADGMLVSSVDSTGRKRSYAYEGHLLLAILDENWHLLIRNWYSSGVLIRQRFANGDTYAYRYTWSPKRTYAESVVITMPGGRQQQLPLATDVPPNLRAE